MEQGLGVIGMLEVAPAVVTANVPRDQPVLVVRPRGSRRVVQAQMIRVELERQCGPGVFGGHRISVGIHRHAELGVGPDGPEDPHIVRLR